MLLLFIKALITNFLPEIQFTISTPLSFLTENRENPQNFQKCATAADLAGVTQGNLSLTGKSVTITSPFSNCCPDPFVLGSARLTLGNHGMMMTIALWSWDNLGETNYWWWRWHCASARGRSGETKFVLQFSFSLKMIAFEFDQHDDDRHSHLAGLSTDFRRKVSTSTLWLSVTWEEHFHPLFKDW